MTESTDQSPDTPQTSLELSADTPGRAIETRQSTTQLGSRAADALDVHGGFALVASGAGLVALACVKSGEATIAPIFAVFGAILIVLGAFYSRIEGGVEATREGIKMVVREAQKQISEADIPPDAQGEVLQRAADEYEPRSRRRDELRRAATVAATRAVDGVERSPAVRGQRLAQAFAEWLEGQGFVVSESARDVGFDVIGVMPDEILMAEVKASTRPIPVEVVRALVGVVPYQARENPQLRVRRALVLPEEPRLTGGAEQAALNGAVEVYAPTERGDFRRYL